MKNYARLSYRDPALGRWKVAKILTFDDAFERQATQAIGELIELAAQWMPHARIAVWDKRRLRKDLAKFVEEVASEC